MSDAPITMSLEPQVEKSDGPPFGPPHTTTTATKKKKGRKKLPKDPKSTTDIPEATFRRIIQELTSYYGTNLRWEDEAKRLLQYESEEFMRELFKNGYRVTQNSNKTTMQKMDFRLALALTHPNLNMI
jgi:histone H3/H4